MDYNFLPVKYRRLKYWIALTTLKFHGLAAGAYECVEIQLVFLTPDLNLSRTASHLPCATHDRDDV